MNCSESETSQASKGIDWDEALNRYENAVNSGDETLITRATIKLARLVNIAPELILVRTLPILIDLLTSPLCKSYGSISEAIALCLKRISSRREIKLAEIIGQPGVISSLLQLLRHCGQHRLLLKCLCNIINFGDVYTVIVVRNGGLEVIINLLNAPSNEYTRQFLLEIFCSLALVKEARRSIISLRGLCFLIESVSRGKMITRRRAAQAIGLLGLAKKARRFIVDEGAIPVLVELLRIGDIQTKLVAGNSIGVISSHVDNLRPVARAGAIPLFVELLEGPNPMGREIAEDVFCILAVVEENAVVIIGYLVRILREGGDEAKCMAADVLWNLCGYKHTLLIQNSGAIPILVQLLRSRNVDLKEKVSGAISQLSYNESDRIALANVGAICVLLDLLQDESEEVRDNVAEALVSFSEDPLFFDNVSEAFSVPAFRNMLERMDQIHESDMHLSRSLRQMSVEELTEDPGLI